MSEGAVISFFPLLVSVNSITITTIMSEKTLTITQAVGQYLNSVKLARSENTFASYKKAFPHFFEVLQKHKIDPDHSPTGDLKETHISRFIEHLSRLSTATARLYIQAVVGFYEYLVSENIRTFNLAQIKTIVKGRARRPGNRLPEFREESMKALLEAIQAAQEPPDVTERLIMLRDRAFLVTLADTGLRVHEACNLRRGDVSWNDGQAIVTGKGNKQAVVRFSDRSIRIIREYLSARQFVDGSSGRSLGSLPVFSRHDPGAGKKVKPITTTTGRNIVESRVREFLGEELVGKITPHSFRHYFVTTVLKASKNIKLAQELARHKNINVTQRYAHLNDDELDRGYRDIFK